MFVNRKRHQRFARVPNMYFVTDFIRCKIKRELFFLSQLIEIYTQDYFSLLSTWLVNGSVYCKSCKDSYLINLFFFFFFFIGVLCNENNFDVSLFNMRHSVHVDSVNLFSNRQKSILIRVDKQASKFNLKSDIPFEEINGKRKCLKRRRRGEMGGVRRIRETKIYHLSVNILALAMKIPIWLSGDMAQPKRPTNGAKFRWDQPNGEKKHSKREKNIQHKQKKERVHIHTTIEIQFRKYLKPSHRSFNLECHKIHVRDSQLLLLFRRTSSPSHGSKIQSNRIELTSETGKRYAYIHR